MATASFASTTLAGAWCASLPIRCRPPLTARARAQENEPERYPTVQALLETLPLKHDLYFDQLVGGAAADAAPEPVPRPTSPAAQQQQRTRRALVFAAPR